jgi:hypothetical protein
MRKNKLITTLLISTLALSSVLTACGSKKNTSENETEVVTEVETQSLQSEAGANIEGTNLEGLTFNQSVAEDSSEVKNLLTSSGIEYSDVILYDFNLTDANNEKVQPNGSVTITFTPELANPNREGATSTYAVYYYDDENGTISPMETTSNGDEVTFTTTHFSYYVLVRSVYWKNENGSVLLLGFIDEDGNYMTLYEYQEALAKKEQEAMEAAEKEEEAKKSQANSSTTSSSTTSNSVSNSDSSAATQDTSTNTSSSDSSSTTNTNTNTNTDTSEYYSNTETLPNGEVVTIVSPIKKGSGELLYTGTNGKLYISDFLTQAYLFYIVENDGTFHSVRTCYPEERYKTVSEGHGDLTFAEKTQECIDSGLRRGLL